MITIVYYGRNDNHGGGFLDRFALSFFTNIYLLEKNRINSEIVVVDYNTDEDKKKLHEILKPKPHKYVKIKFIIVPPSYHKQFKDSDKLPMSIGARNIGIRRSKGEFILSTCADVIFSDGLVKKFDKLKKNIIYRVNRYDVNRYILKCNLRGEEVLNYCEENVIDVHFNTNKGNKIPNTDFQMLHTNNCGDFQLMHKYHWFYLRGYPEIDLMGTHVDTILEYMAVLSGCKEVVFDEKLFHIDHDSRWLKPLYTHVLRNWRMLFLTFGYDVMKFKEEYYKLAKKISKEANEKTYLEDIGVNILSDSEYKAIIADMINKKRSIVYNDENWGAAKENFEVIEV